MSKEKEKSPYGRYSVEEVNRAESGTFTIQVGNELFYEGRYYAWPKAKTEFFYKRIRGGLDDMMKNGNDIEKSDAFKSLCNLRIMPFRIH